jgi:hypothetical protein
MKFGYDKRKAHLASRVVAGEITRDQALTELENPLYTENELVEDKAFVAKKLGITVAELENLVLQPPRQYTEFPNNEARSRRFQARRRSALDDPFVRLKSGWLEWQMTMLPQLSRCAPCIPWSAAKR